MPVVTYIEFNGQEHQLKLTVGTSLMQGAVDNFIEGILAECGGACACATCHCYIEDDWLSVTGTASDAEKGLLKFVDDTKDSSRLSCQINVTEAMDGLVIRLPESQG